MAPRGPKYRVKPGIVFAARESAAPIVPFSWSASKAWRLNSWDQMLIPKPFSTIKVVFGSPIVFEKNSAQTIEESTKLLEDALMSLETSQNS